MGTNILPTLSAIIVCVVFFLHARRDKTVNAIVLALAYGKFFAGGAIVFICISGEHSGFRMLSRRDRYF